MILTEESTNHRSNLSEDAKIKKDSPGPQRPAAFFKSSAAIKSMVKAMLLLMLASTAASNMGVKAGIAGLYLNGIGYREQELQQAKGARFQSEAPEGVNYASFGGGTNIFVSGVGLAEMAQLNMVVLTAQDAPWAGVEFVLPPLTEDDEFHTQTQLGVLVYRLPAPHTFLGLDQDDIDSFSSLTFHLHIVAIIEGSAEPIKCKSNSLCKVRYHRSYTPVLHYLNPPVVYSDMLVEVHFDPKSTTNLIESLATDEMPFINTKIAGALMDFEDHVESTVYFSHWWENTVRGYVGDQVISPNQAVTMLWETGHAIKHLTRNWHCSYDQSECYEAKTVPSISSVGEHTGYLTGGQNLTIKGSGFATGDIAATLDGVECEVTSRGKDQFCCTVGPKAEASVADAPTAGEHGVRKRTIDGSDWSDVSYWYDIDLEAPEDDVTITHSVALQYEGGYSVGSYYVNHYYGWFVAPATTRYRFYVVCDDHCAVQLGLTPGSADAPETILDTDTHTDKRWAWAEDDETRVSDWYELTEGEQYYLESEHQDWSGGDHFTLSVEIERNLEEHDHHHHAKKELQYIGFQTEPTHELTRILIRNVDDGEFKLRFLNPETLEKTDSDLMTADASASEVKSAIKDYYDDDWGSGITVTKKYFDVQGTELDDEDDEAFDHVQYEISLDDLIDGVTTNDIRVIQTSSVAIIEVELPEAVQLSGPPLSGKWKVQCVNENGQVQYTDGMTTSKNYHNVEIRINADCAGFRDKVRVRKRPDYDSNTIGSAFLIYFEGVHGDVGQFTAVSDDDDPMGGENLQYFAETIAEYSTNLLYEPIPFEMLRTYETKPQLVVSVDGLPAVCQNVDCDFTYAATVGEVTEVAFDEPSGLVTITGTDLPALATDIQSVSFALTECVVDADTVSSAGLECTLTKEATCGDHVPMIMSRWGGIPAAADLTAVTVVGEITGIAPTAELNLLGADNITLTGTHLPHTLSTSTVEIQFDDAQATKCVAVATKSDELVCLTEAFDADASTGGAYTLTVVINGQSVSNSVTQSLKSDVRAASALTPSSASPVLKTPIEIQLDTDFPYTLAKEHFSVNATSTEDSTYIRYLNVVGVDDGAKTLTCLFGGAYSGEFQIHIRHSVYGLVDTEGMILDVRGAVTSFSPTTGSKYGGTLLTIEGENFGNEITDNPVQIAFLDGLSSSWHCFVLTTGPNQITCRVDTSNDAREQEGEQAAMVVFLKTSEEAVCDGECGYTFTGVLPTVASYSAEFDAASEAWQVRVSGTGFTGDAASVDLVVDDVTQETVSVSETEALFSITDVSDSAATSVVLYFPVGIPEGHDTFADGLTLEPRLTRISPNEGSTGGSLITATAPGVGAGTADITLVDSAGDSICDSLEIVAYSQIECRTVATAMADGPISIKQGGTTTACENSDSSVCMYKQLADPQAFPEVSSLSQSGDTLVFTGLNFFTSDYSAKATFMDIEADSVTIDSETQVTATWSKGVPTTSSDTSEPVLYFEKDGSTEAHFAISTAVHTNVLTVASSSSGLQCSFAGGCTYEVTVNSGLASLLKHKPDENYIQVCESPCEYLDSESTSSAVKCKLPPLSTAYSNANFQISTPSVSLDSGTHFGTGEDYELALDGVIATKNEDDSSDCNVGMEFRAGYVGMLSQVKFFLDDIAEIVLTDNLAFEGSQDGETYENLFTLDENVHEGWNYHEWEEPDEQPKYRYYRFQGLGESTPCHINEVIFSGVEAVDSSDSTYPCTPALVMEGETSIDLNAVTYAGSLTPLLTSISPRFGSVEGGTEVTFTGEDFSSNTGDYTIVIDGIDCPVSAATSTSVTCTTGGRPGLVETSLVMEIAGKGTIAKQGLFFRYVSMWSAESTWGGEFAPMDGESIHIPVGLNLLVDIDKSPLLKLVLVEGSLIFAPDENADHERYWDAYYMYINAGTMEVGTEEHPYTSKITITMHGNVSDPYIPIYGNKCIGLRFGTLDMHGVQRTPVWTSLETTAAAGSDQLTVWEAVDWAVGELIAVASTTTIGREGEQRTITAIDRSDPDKPILTLDKPLEFLHWAATETRGDQSMETRAEVGLLSRNVVYRGDPETSSANEYGATLFMHSSGDDSLTARLTYVEFTDVGQAFKLGRYAVHFHMIGAVHTSYVEGCATHQGYNRAYTIHGTHYLRLMNNVAFEVKGHNVFIEDAVESHNYIYHNLVMKVMRSWSGLNTDQTPACFWITNPNNQFIENHAAGSDRYGYWYDLQTHAMGPSASVDICPENVPVGEFRGNYAHSCGRYGLRIFHNMVPRTYPCQPIVYDPDTPDDPYHTNPPITARFEEFTSWKNGRNGAIAEKIGDVRFLGFKTADNVLAGMEMGRTNEFGDEMAQIDGALVIGRTLNPDEVVDWANPKGVITARTENMVVRNVNFYNFEWNDAAALGSCSKCHVGGVSDSGARTVRTEGLYFDSTVARKIRYQTPRKAIYLDLDGSLTGRGPNSWATPYYKHHDQPECEQDLDVLDGVTCDSTVQVRRVAFHQGIPSGVFNGIGLKVLRYDDDLLAAQEDLEAYEDDKDNYATIEFKMEDRPMNGWATPFVTGHKYKLHWGLYGLDFDGMTADVSDRWQEADKNIVLVHNFTDAREAIETEFNGVAIENATIPEAEEDYQTGQNLIYESEDLGKFYWVVNGKFGEGNNNPYERTLTFTARRPPVEDFVETLDIEETERMWSDPASWGEDGHVPLEDEYVIVGAGWNMILDVEEPPNLGTLEIRGSLRLRNDQDVRLSVANMWIRGGRFEAGTSRFPYTASLTITLLGGREQTAVAVEQQGVAAGNKVIANVGTLRLFGTERANTMTRLLAVARKGDTAITVEPGLDLVPGDRIALAPTSYAYWAGEEAFIDSYDADTGAVVLDRALTYYHWGAAESTGADYSGLDMRGEVLILTRKIRIVGQDEDGWGGQVLTADVVESDGTDRTGMLQMDSVEVYNCSQVDTHYAAIRFDNALTMGHRVTNSAIHNGLGWGLKAESSRNLNITGNVFFSFRQIGVGFDSVQNVVYDSNVFAVVVDRPTREMTGMGQDTQGGIAVCSQTHPMPCTEVQITNNIMAGAVYAGFLTMAQDCDDDSALTFKDNVAHSVDGGLNGLGAYIYADPSKESHAECHQASHFSVYKTADMGIFGWSVSKHAKFTHITAVDVARGVSLALAQDEGEYQDTLVEITDSTMYGDFSQSEDCPEDGSFCTQFSKGGLATAVGRRGHASTPHEIMPSHLPLSADTKWSVWSLKVKLTNLHFKGFAAETSAGEKNQALFFNPEAADHIPIHEFENVVFEDVAPEAFAWFLEPPDKWAKISKCGEFPCTGPKNTLFRFTGVTYTGSVTPGIDDAAFTLVPATENYAEHLTGCVSHPEWNAYLCDNLQLGQLVFESEDSDRFDRSVQPVYVRDHNEDGTYTMNNKLNSMKDRGCDTGYASQKRMTRFPALAQGDNGAYDLVYTGSPPKKQRFTFLAADDTAALTIRIAYPGAEARAITMDGETVPHNLWDDDPDVMAYGPIAQDKGCGENRYIGVKNILEFYLTNGCTLQIVPKDSIQTMVRMEWTKDEFFENGGTTEFMDRLAGSLGIHASTIKVVSVYEGSLVVNYELTASEAEPDMSLEDLGAAQTEAFATGTADLGCEDCVLSVAATPTQAYVPNVAAGEAPAPEPEAEAIVSDGVVTADGYDPIILTHTATNACKATDWVNYQFLTLADELLFGLLQEQVRGFKPGCRAAWELEGAQRPISGYIGMTLLLSVATYWVSSDSL